MLLSVAMPTHAIKKFVEDGPLKGRVLSSASAPNTRLLETCIENIKNNLQGVELEFVISLDYKTDVDLCHQYFDNLKKLEADNENVKLTSVNYQMSDNIRVAETATYNYFNAIDNCSSEYFLFWEHDWIFKEKINLEEASIWEDGRELLRFNQVDNVWNPERNFLTWQDERGLRTNLYSGNPFICSKTLYNNVYRPIAMDIPNLAPHMQFAAQVEGPIQKYMCNNPQKIDDFKIYLYGGLGHPATVAHLDGQNWRGK